VDSLQSNSSEHRDQAWGRRPRHSLRAIGNVDRRTFCKIAPAYAGSICRPSSPSACPCPGAWVENDAGIYETRPQTWDACISAAGRHGNSFRCLSRHRRHSKISKVDRWAVSTLVWEGGTCRSSIKITWEITIIFLGLWQYHITLHDQRAPTLYPFGSPRAMSAIASLLLPLRRDRPSRVFSRHFEESTYRVLSKQWRGIVNKPNHSQGRLWLQRVILFWEDPRILGIADDENNEPVRCGGVFILCGSFCSTSSSTSEIRIISI